MTTTYETNEIINISFERNGKTNNMDILLRTNGEGCYVCITKANGKSFYGTTGYLKGNEIVKFSALCRHGYRKVKESQLIPLAVNVKGLEKYSRY